MNAAILLAGGSGRRMEGAVDDKVLAPLRGRCALLRCLHALAGGVDAVCIVCRDDAQQARVEALLRADPAAAPGLAVQFARGGAERQDSVLAGLEALPEGTDLVFIHDAARPLLTAGTVAALAALAREHGAAVAARLVTDTIKQLAADSAPADTAPPPLQDIPRATLRAMETPQVFRRVDILAAYRRVRAQGLHVTDDAAAAALLGIHPALYAPEHPNPKLTTPTDVAWIEFLLDRQPAPTMDTTLPSFRIGHGYDIHRFAAGRRLVLGGVEIPHSRGLDGHSDADCLCHAIADAILGAGGLRDIGHYFPPGRAETKDMDSLDIVRRAVAEVAALGYTVGNIDCTLVAAEPRIAPHIDAMKARLSAALGIPPAAIGIKATTNEGIGGLGRAEGIAAHAVALLGRGGRIGNGRGNGNGNGAEA